MTRYLITGGCGFVGSRMCLGIRAADPSAEIVAFDNLRRFQADYPEWEYQYDLRTTVQEIVDATRERMATA